MKRLLIILDWEIRRFLPSRNFLMATFALPLVFSAIVLIPSYFYDQSQGKQDQIFGCVELDSTGYGQLLSERLAIGPDALEADTRLLLQPIFPDTTSEMRSGLAALAASQAAFDSLKSAYNVIKEKRNYFFQRPKSTTKRGQMNSSYEQMISTREERDLAEIEFERQKSRMDSMLVAEILAKADSMLRAKQISGYVVIDSSQFRQGIVEFHSNQAASFLRLQPLKQALQSILVEERMRRDGITVTRIQEMLEPINIRQILRDGATRQTFNFMITYLAPIIVVLLLFISIFTSSGFLFKSVISEKTNRVLEVMLASANTAQIIGGKVIGMLLLGLIQIILWLVITLVLIKLNVIPIDKMVFLNWHNAGLFVLYFVLGYLLFGAIFVGGASLSASVHDAQQLTQLMRILSILPIALVILVFQFPDSMLVKFLSFFPFLTPTFMLLRTPLGQPPQIDYIISVVIMLVFIIAFFAITVKLFRMASLLYDRKISLKSVVELLRER